MDRIASQRINRRNLIGTVGGAAGLAALGAVRPAMAGPATRRGRVQVNAQASGEIEFAYFNWGPESIDYFKSMAAAFESSHAGTKINLTLPPFDQYDQKLNVLLATGNGPDIITINNATLALVQAGRILDLTDRIAADPALSDPNVFVQSGWDLFKFGTDRTYGIYSGADTLLLYYNKTAFDKAGVGYPTAEWTRDDFVEAAKALTIREGDRVTQWGCVLGSFNASWGWANLVWMEGGDIVDSRPFYSKVTLNNEPVLTILHFLNDLVYTHQVAPTPSQNQSVSDQGGFESGTIAMAVDGGWSMQPWKAIDAFEWDVQTLPVGSQGFVGEFWPGTPFLISASSENPDLAWEYAKWFASDKEAQTLIANQAIQVPALLEVANSPDFLGQAGLPGNAEAWVRSLQTARPGDTFHAKQSEMVDKVWTPAWEKFQNNSITAEEFATTVEADGNKILAES